MSFGHAVFVVVVVVLCNQLLQHNQRAAPMLFRLVPSWWNFHWAEEAERSFIIPQRVASACSDIVLSGPAKSTFDVLIAQRTHSVAGWSVHSHLMMHSLNYTMLFWEDVGLFPSEHFSCQYNDALWLKWQEDDQLQGNAQQGLGCWNIICEADEADTWTMSSLREFIGGIRQ